MRQIVFHLPLGSLKDKWILKQEDGIFIKLRCKYAKIQEQPDIDIYQTDGTPLTHFLAKGGIKREDTSVYEMEDIETYNFYIDTELIKTKGVQVDT